MARDDIIARLNDIFRDLFMDDRISLSDCTTAADVEGWDSLTHINVIIAVESAFDIKLDMAEVAELRDVGELVTRIEEAVRG